ncbi:MAG: T9SS type A sorting domain-containing protein [Bacteroidia bacterium]|nr:T9SS type A sorting domain-containing protein [Bacteroidia bacterium]
MKKLYMLLIMLLPAFAAFAQVCVPDPTLNKPGIKPTVLPNGQVGVAYSQVISLLVPLDTFVFYNGNKVDVRVDSSTVIYLSSFPPGFSYQTDKPSKTWNGGQKGCARLFGLPTAANRNSYKIWVKTHTFFKIVGLSGSFDQVDSSAIDFVIDWKTGINETGKASPLKMYPNPVSNLLTVEVENYSEATTYKIVDIMGKEFTPEPIYSPNTGEVKFNLSLLPAGIYIIKSASEGRVAQSRFIKE